MLAVSVTINKSHGHSFDRTEIFVNRPLFSYGQLYVALSRCRAKSGLKILLHILFAQPIDI